MEKRTFNVERLEERIALATDTLEFFEIGTGPNVLSSNPASLIAVGPTLYFVADNGAGPELWKSDGTQAGTALVKNIMPDPIIVRGSSAFFLTNVNGTLFFSANDNPDVDDHELWKSDGTFAGTVRVKDILPGSFGSGPRYLTNVSGTLFFTLSTANELWKSDGTTAGTVLVKDIGGGVGSYLPELLTNVGGTLYFRANDGVNGEGLWKSDGTSTGTVMVKSIGIRGPANLTSMTNVGGTMYFAADDGVNGVELWKSDGTTAGTVLVKDISTGTTYGTPYSGFPVFLTNVGGTLFFTAADQVNGRELWTSDGTEAGTVLVKEIAPGPASAYPQYLTNFGGTLYFAPGNSLNSDELWKSDGTSAGTVQVKDFLTESGYGIRSLANVAGELFFMADDLLHGGELWKSDGTQAGTVLVKDIEPGSAGSGPHNLTNVGGDLFFAAFTTDSGNELWKLTPGLTPRVTNVAVKGTTWNPSLPAFNISVGSGSQLIALPWTNVDQILITFNEDVQISSDDLQLLGVNLASNAISGFSYDSATRTATWTFAVALTVDKLTVRIDGASNGGVRDLFGALLDGEWNNPTTTGQGSSDTFPSGDGSAGGNFSFRVNAVPGDVTGEGVTNIGDVLTARALVPNPSTTNPRADVNADGVINIGDVLTARSRVPATLPNGEPPPPPPAPLIGVLLSQAGVSLSASQVGLVAGSGLSGTAHVATGREIQAIRPKHGRPSARDIRRAAIDLLMARREFNSNAF